MSIFHKHRLRFVATTYAPPVTSIKSSNGGDAEAIQRLLLGCTSFVWACEDEDCDHRSVTVALGKVVES